MKSIEIKVKSCELIKLKSSEIKVKSSEIKLKSHMYFAFLLQAGLKLLLVWSGPVSGRPLPGGSPSVLEGYIYIYIYTYIHIHDLCPSVLAQCLAQAVLLC